MALIGRTAAEGMLIVNADDWGGWKGATDAALACFNADRVASVSAMVFMEDSERAARLAIESGVDVGLHINFNQILTGFDCPPSVIEDHSRVRWFLRSHKYAQLVYHPGLRAAFQAVFQAQCDEFVRLYSREPSHFDGHQHMHLCANSLLQRVIPSGRRVRRSFSFWPGEKGFLNRAYRRWVDRRLRRAYIVTDYFFALSQSLDGQRLGRVSDLAKTCKVELMTHPEQPKEMEWLLSDAFLQTTRTLRRCSYKEI